jgi:hypothetical protein
MTPRSQAEWWLEELLAVDPAPRADMVRVLERITRHLPEVWRRRRGVRMLMAHTDGPHEVRVARTGMATLSAYGYADEFHRWAGLPVSDLAKEHGCAALVHGNRVHARFNQIGPFGAALFAPDTGAHIVLCHRDVRRMLGFGLSFTVRGRIAPRMVVDRGIHDALDRAARAR